MKDEKTKICSFSLARGDKKFIDREAAKLGLSSSAWLRLMIRSCASGQSTITPPTVEDFVNLYHNVSNSNSNSNSNKN